jgi:hypothetical protein
VGLPCPSPPASCSLRASQGASQPSAITHPGCAGWRRGQYSAERMNLVILGGEPLDTLERWAGEMFSGVPGGRGPSPQFHDTGFPFEVGRARGLAGWLGGLCGVFGPA